MTANAHAPRTDLKASLLTIFGDKTLIRRVDAKADEANHVVMLQVTHLHTSASHFSFDTNGT